MSQKVRKKIDLILLGDWRIGTISPPPPLAEKISHRKVARYGKAQGAGVITSTNVAKSESR